VAEVIDLKKQEEKASYSEAVAAIKTLLSYMGEDPTREGLLDTPERVLRSYKELFGGYEVDTKAILAKKFRDVSSYAGIVLLDGIELKSTCEHHMQPIIGKASIAYYPNGEVIGISKLSRLVSAFARRLQIQEKLTAEIAQELQKEFNPKGVAVQIEASHFCMIARGVNDSNSKMTTRFFTGCFEDNLDHQKEFVNMLK